MPSIKPWQREESESFFHSFKAHGVYKKDVAPHFSKGLPGRTVASLRAFSSRWKAYLALPDATPAAFWDAVNKEQIEKERLNGTPGAGRQRRSSRVRSASKRFVEQDEALGSPPSARKPKKQLFGDSPKPRGRGRSGKRSSGSSAVAPAKRRRTSGGSASKPRGKRSRHTSNNGNTASPPTSQLEQDAVSMLGGMLSPASRRRHGTCNGSASSSSDPSDDSDTAHGMHTHDDDDDDDDGDMDGVNGLSGNGGGAMLPVLDAMSRDLRTRLAAARTPKQRAWVMYQWFVPSLDRLFYTQNEFAECLHACGFGQVSKLPRRAWKDVRKALGQPRRLSAAFFREELGKLSQYRSDVRGLQRGLPVVSAHVPFTHEAPLRLSTGQKVTAIHPQTHALAEGEVVAPYALQPFDSGATAGVVNALGGSSATVKPYAIRFGGAGPVLSVSDTDVMPHTLPRGFGIGSPPKVQKGSHIGMHGNANGLAAQGQRPFPRDAKDLSLVARVLGLLDKKHALVAHLQAMNDCAEQQQQQAGASSSSSSAVKSEAFQQQYAWVVVAIERASKELEAAMLQLRLRRSQARHSTPVPLAPVGRQGGGGARAAALCRAEAEGMLGRACARLGYSGSSLLSHERGGIRDFVVSCLTVALLLQDCAAHNTSSAALGTLMSDLERNTSRNQGRNDNSNSNQSRNGSGGAGAVNAAQYAEVQKLLDVVRRTIVAQ